MCSSAAHSHSHATYRTFRGCDSHPPSIRHASRSPTVSISMYLQWAGTYAHLIARLAQFASRPQSRARLPSISGMFAAANGEDIALQSFVVFSPTLRQTMMRSKGRGWYTRDRQPREYSQAGWGKARHTSILPSGLASRGVRGACGLRRCRSVVVASFGGNVGGR